MSVPDRSYFLDANVLVSAILFSGPEERLVQAGEGGVRLQTTPYVLAQVRRVLTAKFKLPESQVDQVLRLLPVQVVAEANEATVARAQALLRDPSDAPVLAAAWDCGATALVTGDRDLLDLGDAAALPVLRAAQLQPAPPGAADSA